VKVPLTKVERYFAVVRRQDEQQFASSNRKILDGEKAAGNESWNTWAALKIRRPGNLMQLAGKGTFSDRVVESGIS